MSQTVMLEQPVSTSSEDGPDGQAESSVNPLDLLSPLDTFARRHIGPDAKATRRMLEALDVTSLDALIDQTIPQAIRTATPLNLPAALSESQILTQLRDIADQNKVYRSFIGLGYYHCLTPAVIQRNILENPGWYTQYTPYQAEIAQGRLEALLNFQTMITDLTGLEIANASLLDEGTAAAEAMALCLHARPRQSTANTFFISEKCHPQTIAVLQTRAAPLGINLIVGDHATYEVDEETFGILIQYPDTEGNIFDYATFCDQAHTAKALVVVATDLLALTLLRSSGEFGADIAVGNSQRFGVPLGYGGPHAAFMATKEAYKRLLPGRLVGVSKDVRGKPALRLALQTREQHIRRDRATSNICTAQVLLAVMASMYAVYHGPEGLTRIAQRVKLLTTLLAQGLHQAGYTLNEEPYFDTLKITDGPRHLAEVAAEAVDMEVNLRCYADGSIGISLDEATTLEEIKALLNIFGAKVEELDLETLVANTSLTFAGPHQRTSPFLTHPIFNTYHTETELLRYIHKLQARDLSLIYSMIPLGSCTMKLNATVEMLPVTWPEFAHLHPFAPLDQAAGYHQLCQNLETWLAEITGLAATSLQPNAGSQGEYAGLLAIRAYHQAQDEGRRDVCLIPSSAHGTNPASAIMAGMVVVVVKCDHQGNIDLDDLKAKAEKHQDRLAALMVTYPSTHGVFEEAIIEICALIHQYGGQIYMDGANMNAQVGLCRPGDFGVDVCHLNLHKTFCIPHGGGGPGVGPICVAEHLVPFLPSPVPQTVRPTKQANLAEDQISQAVGPVASAPWGSTSILPISYTYIASMGAVGLTEATKAAILNANYIAHRLAPYYPILYKGKQGFVAHECIIDLRPLKKIGVEVEDVAKRLMDYGFHAPTMAWPVAGTLMIEPTESESLDMLDRFCDALIAIHDEIKAIEQGQFDRHDNPLKNAPHPAELLMTEAWGHPYTREQAVYPVAWVKDHKFWPAVARIDNVYGDRNLFCSCVPVDDYD